MSKRMTLKTEDDDVKQEETVQLTHVALGTFKNEDTGEWMVAKIKFNPLTGHAELTDKIHAGPSRDFGIEKFKIEAVAEGIVG